MVASDLPVLREVLGDPAIYVDPLSPVSMAGGLRKVLTDEAVRAQLARLGPARAGLYTLDRSVRHHLDVYRRVLATQSVRPG